MKKFEDLQRVSLSVEGHSEPWAFFALFASFNLLIEKEKETLKPNMYSTPAAIAYCYLQELKEKYPKEYAEAELLYEEAYSKQSNQ